MEDAIKSIKAHLYDRVASPLSGSLIISWVLWNYKFLFILFSSEHVSIRFALIKDIYYQETAINLYSMQFHTLHWVKFGVVFPFVSALLYIFVYPLLSLPVYRFSLWAQNKFIDAKNVSDKKKRLTVEESAAIIEESYSRKQDYETRLSKHESDNIATQKQLKELRSSMLQREGDADKSKAYESQIQKLNKIIDDLTKASEEKTSSEPEGVLAKSHEDANSLESTSSVSSKKNITVTTSSIEYMFSSFHSNMQQFPAGTEFMFSDIFDPNVWMAMESERQDIFREKFIEAIDVGDFAYVKYNSEESSFSIKLFDEYIVVATKFVMARSFVDGLFDPTNEFIMRDKTFHKELIGLVLDDLVDKLWLDKRAYGGSFRYHITYIGRQYVNANGLV